MMGAVPGPIRFLRGSVTRTLFAAVLGGLVVAAAAPARAADPGANIDHLAVSADGSRIEVLFGLPPGVDADPATVQASIDGAPATAEAERVASGDIDRSVVLTLDASNSMGRAGKFEAAKAAAIAYLDAAPADVRIGLVTFAGAVVEVAAPTTDRAGLRSAVEGLTLSRGTKLYDAVAAASQAVGDSGARSILLLSDGKDSGSERALAEAIEEAQQGQTVVDVVALDQRPSQRALMEQLSSQTGGDVVPGDPESLADTFEAQARALASQLLVSIPRPAGAATEATVSVTVTGDSGATLSDSALVTLPALQSEPETRIGQGSLVGTPALALGALALTAGLAGLIWVASASAAGGASLAQRQIEHYTRASGDAGGARAANGASVDSASLRASAVHATQKLIKGDFESRLSNRLTGAGLAWTPAEWLLLHVGITVAAAFVGLLLRGPLLMLLLGLVGAAVPWLYLRRKHSKRLTAFEAQLPETLQMLAGGLSAGLSLPQAVDTVVREGAEPMAGELKRALIEQRLGVDITDSMDTLALRMNSKDFAWVVMAVRIQREVGGNLAELLNTVADTMREREYLRGQVRVLSAEGRISAWVLGALPIVMAIYLALFRPDFLRPLFSTFAGLLMLALAVSLLAIGFFVLNRLTKIEV